MTQGWEDGGSLFKPPAGKNQGLGKGGETSEKGNWQGGIRDEFRRVTSVVERRTKLPDAISGVFCYLEKNSFKNGAGREKRCTGGGVGGVRLETASVGY